MHLIHYKKTWSKYNDRSFDAFYGQLLAYFPSCYLQLLRPIYKQIAEMQNAEIFSANTLLVILGTSLLTARVSTLNLTIFIFKKSFCHSYLFSQAGLSMALGAFLAGLLLAETEFSLQVESDIAPYRGLLLGLFFMTVGRIIFVSQFKIIYHN